MSISHHAQTQLITTHTLHHIIAKGTKLVADNHTVRKHMLNYTKHANISVTNELVLHAGQKGADEGMAENQEAAPANLKKDKRCFYSVNFSPFKREANSQSKPNINGDTTRTRSPRLSRRSSTGTNRNAISRTQREDKAMQKKFIDLSSIIEPNKGRKITQGMISQEKRIQELRNKCISEQKAMKAQASKDSEQQKHEQQRVQHLKNRFHKYMSQKNHNFSYDTDGKCLFFQTQTQHISLRRKYPPSNLTYKFDQPQEPSPEDYNPPHIKQKAAKGQAFASAVLKTMNMSKFSLNMTSKTCNIDEFAFMKRNDLFNNNHSRQTTTIPYLQVCEGTNYTETNTNLSVSKKKSQRTSHSENKSKFKTHQLEFLRDNTDLHNNKTQIMEPEKQEKGPDRRRIQSSRPYARPKQSVPQTAKTTDRIISVNQKLKFELIE